jgi:DNA replication protein DnaC
MRWEDFVTLYKIPPQFQSASLSSVSDSLKKTALEWLKSNGSLVLTGKTGRGKTYYMVALMRLLLKFYDCHVLLFKNAKLIDDEIVDTLKEEGNPSWILEKYREVDFLFVDDWGVGRHTERAERDWYDIIDYRWSHRKSTVFSTNLSGKQIEELYGARIFSRLKDFGWLQFTGEDKRGAHD